MIKKESFLSNLFYLSNLIYQIDIIDACFWCFFQQILRQNGSSFLSHQRKMLIRKGFILKPRERAWIPLKNGTKVFSNSPPFKISAYFYVIISRDLNVLITLTLKHVSGKRKALLKNWSTVFSWTYYDWKRNISYKTVLPKTNVKTNRMESTKWICHKERGFVTITTIFFWKIIFSIRTSYKYLVWSTNYWNAHINIFLKRLSFILACHCTKNEVFY